MKTSFRKPSTPNKLHRHKVTLDCSFTKGSIHTRTRQMSLSVELIHFIDMVSQEKKRSTCAFHLLVLTGLQWLSSHPPGDLRALHASICPWALWGCQFPLPAPAHSDRTTAEPHKEYRRRWQTPQNTDELKVAIKATWAWVTLQQSPNQVLSVDFGTLFRSWTFLYVNLSRWL